MESPEQHYFLTPAEMAARGIDGAFEHEIRLPLTPERSAAIGMELCGALDKLTNAETYKKDKLKECNDKIASSSLMVDHLKRSIQDGKETKRFMILPVAYPKAGVVRYLDAKNFDALGSRFLSDDEKRKIANDAAARALVENQMSLLPDHPPAETVSGKDAAPEEPALTQLDIDRAIKLGLFLGQAELNENNGTQRLVADIEGRWPPKDLWKPYERFGALRQKARELIIAQALTVICSDAPGVVIPEAAPPAEVVNAETGEVSGEVKAPPDAFADDGDAVPEKREAEDATPAEEMKGYLDQCEALGVKAGAHALESQGGKKLPWKKHPTSAVFWAQFEAQIKPTRHLTAAEKDAYRHGYHSIASETVTKPE